MSKAPKPPILYDTSLRDGLQARGVNLSLSEKLQVYEFLLDLEIPYIECGWPGANPKDTELFDRLRERSEGSSKIVAFGATRKPNTRVSLDPQILALKSARTEVVTLVAKAHAEQVQLILNTSLKENLLMISDSVKYFKDNGREVIIDAEHFFDGYLHNPDYAEACVDQALSAGADGITFCDTNGGQMPDTIGNIVSHFSDMNALLGIHCHNDCDLAVANSLAAWQAGATIIQGTINGVGERCGNANLTSIIPILALKYQQNAISENKLKALRHYAKLFSDYFNTSLGPFTPFVGDAAFTHKGGLHAAAVSKASHTYEHIPPESVGNRRLIAVSEQSGRANIQKQAEQLGLTQEQAKVLLEKVKGLDKEGIDFEEADASFFLFAQRLFNKKSAAFEILSFNSQVFHSSGAQHCQTTVKIRVKDKTLLSVAEADGPVEALDQAFRSALREHFPQLDAMLLSNYKVRILDPQSAAAATTRVWIEARYRNQTWCTVGCSKDILAASSQALSESFDYFITEVLSSENQTESQLERKPSDDHQAA